MHSFIIIIKKVNKLNKLYIYFDTILDDAKLCRLMPVDQPLMIDPVRLAREGKVLQGHFQISQFERLSSAVLEGNSDIEFVLNFSKDSEQQIVIIKGEVQVILSMRCQRCLEPVQVDIHSSVGLGVVSTEDKVADLPINLEPVITSNTTLSLPELIEDEVLLALPVAPVHDETDCSASDVIEKFRNKNTYKPFEKLKILQKTDY